MKLCGEAFLWVPASIFGHLAMNQLAIAVFAPSKIRAAFGLSREAPKHRAKFRMIAMKRGEHLYLLHGGMLPATRSWSFRLSKEPPPLHDRFLMSTSHAGRLERTLHCS